eukprot:TRINITY_DN3401_c0_g2_i2.p1 TRINITY_DN3401_c0_g2~~TRINITY_DN3401_c0_g2_i2.p1  ORF type:complete len:344 (+),score=50.68 TRINITY_DN3401_c0_g2_i2:229-1260(+)
MNTMSSKPNHSETTSSLKDADCQDEGLKRKVESNKGKEKVVKKVVKKVYKDITWLDYVLEIKTAHGDELYSEKSMKKPKILGKEKENATVPSKSITTQEQQGKRLLPGEPILSQLIQAADLFQKLDLRSILSLLLTSTHLFKQISPLLSDQYLLHCHEHTNIQLFYPKKILITHSKYFEKLFDNPFLTNLYKIRFGDNCELRIPKLPSSVTHLHLGPQFDLTVNSSVHNFSPSLTHLTFGRFFSQAHPIKHLPPSLTHLKFDEYFNEPVDSLPNKLTHIEFGERFYKPLTQLPASVQQVTFCKQYKHPVDHLSKDIQFLIKVVEKGKWVIKPYQYKPQGVRLV